MAVFGARKRKCCEIRRGWDGGAVCMRPAIAAKAIGCDTPSDQAGTGRTG